MKVKVCFVTLLCIFLFLTAFYFCILFPENNQNNHFDISALIEKYGYPGVVPSPTYLENFGEKDTIPKVKDWVRPLSLTVGVRNILVILIDFPDRSGGQTVNYFQDFLFKNESGNLRHYYLEVSYGLLNISGYIAGNRWYRSEHNLTWWGADSEGGIDDLNGYIFELAREAVEKADSDVDFSVFDTNNNGIIDPEELSLCIIHAGNDQASSGVSTDIWSHFWYIFGAGYGYPDLIVDGVRLSKHPNDNVGGYWMVAETDPLGVYAHEFGHDLGLPDLYDTDLSSDGIGDWGLMSSGSWLGPPGKPGECPAHLSAWCKVKLGWINPVTISSPAGNVEIPQVETNSTVYKLEISETEYFLIVNRQKVGYDYYLPGSGILIWHVDESVSDNTDENHKLVDLEEAHGGIQNLDFAGDGNMGDPYDPFYSPHKTEFTDNSDPNCRAYNGSETRLWVTNISESSSIMSADFLLNLLPNANFTVCQSPPYYAPVTLTFNASSSTTLYGEIESYTWDFNSDGVADAYGMITNYTFPDAGVYMVTLNVTNSDGYWDTMTLNITVDKRDIALLKVSVNTDEIYVHERVFFNLTVVNLGTTVESFNLTLYLNETIIATLTVNELFPDETYTVILEWTAQGVEPNREYAVWAQITTLPSEFNTENNTYVNGTIRILEKHGAPVSGVPYTLR